MFMISVTTVNITKFVCIRKHSGLRHLFFLSHYIGLLYRVRDVLSVFYVVIHLDKEIEVVRSIKMN